MNQTLRTLCLLVISVSAALAQRPKEYIAAEAGDPGRARPDYAVPYGPTTVTAITAVLDRIHAYLNTNTPARVIDKQTGEGITDFSRPDPNAAFERGHFPIMAYEWGVVYSGMLLAHENTGEARYQDYVGRRMQLI